MEHILVSILSPVMEMIAPIIPGEFFPYFFTMEMFQRSLIASILVTITACLIGSFLLLRNLALIGDGLAHVSFGGIAIAIALGSTAPLWYALIFSVISSVIIYELQSREILSGDASIAIFLTGMLGLGLVVLRIWGGGITTDIEGYMFGSLLLVDNQSLNLIIIIFIITLISIFALYRGLLAISLDSVSAEVQGLPVRHMGLWFSILTALVVVSMVKITGTLLATALLVTPAATAQQVSRSFKTSLIWSQVFGLITLFLGLYFSAEKSTGSGSMIALVSVIIFAVVAITAQVYKNYFQGPNSAK
ncbi:MAG: hypothetical protein CMB73_00610 [Euryarchaeota archaeon]|nr:hypothetical protein [Euryarchaeota archaeon]|tara:strand:+ start:1511 stop:2422 length:912 start_codon:yes stop_codon:yes gene_type:complete